MYADRCVRNIVMPCFSGAGTGRRFFRDDHFGSSAFTLPAAQDALPFGTFAFALFKVLHFTGQLIPGIRRCVKLAEFIRAQICSGRTAVLQLILPLQP